MPDVQDSDCIFANAIEDAVGISNKWNNTHACAQLYLWCAFRSLADLSYRGLNAIFERSRYLIAESVTRFGGDFA
jgi:hypothetical protein